jgi:hypothetical protein
MKYPRVSEGNIFIFKAETRFGSSHSTQKMEAVYSSSTLVSTPKSTGQDYQK